LADYGQLAIFCFELQWRGFLVNRIQSDEILSDSLLKKREDTQ
jgi:hypothetical protein